MVTTWTRSGMGVHARSSCREFVPGVHARSLRQEFVPGVSAGSLHREFAPGVHARSLRREFMPGVRAESYSMPSGGAGEANAAASGDSSGFVLQFVIRLCYGLCYRLIRIPEPDRVPTGFAGAKTIKKFVGTGLRTQTVWIRPEMRL